MPAIPLRLRLPNPPSGLVRREALTVRLAALLASGPLVMVVGPAGSGRRTLVLDVLHRDFPQSVAQGVLVQTSGQDLLAAATAAIEAAFGGASSREASGEPLAHLIDLADQHAAWVVVDARGPALAPDLLEAIPRYARTSHWVLLSEPPAPACADAELVVEVPAWTRDALIPLARAWAPSLEDAALELALSAARGLPGQLRSLASAVRARGPTALISTDTIGEELLALVGATTAPVAIGALSTAIGTGALARVDELVERAVLERDGDEVALAPAARALVPASALVRARVEALVRVLAGSANLLAWAEAVRLGLSVTPACTEVRSVLEQHGAALFEGATAGRMAQLLLTTTDAAVADWRLQAAVVLGSADPASLAEGGDGSPAAQLAHAEGLMRANQIAAALAVTHEMTDPAAQLLSARALVTLGELETARSTIATLRERADLPRVQVHAMALGARVEALAGRAPEASAILATLEARVPHLPVELARDALASMAATYHDLGMLDASESALDRREQLGNSGDLEVFAARRSALLRAAILVDRGELVRAETALDAVEAASGLASLHRPFIALLRAQVALSRGQMAACNAMLAAIPRESLEERYLGGWASALLHRAALETGDEVGSPTRAAEELWSTIARCHRARALVRRGVVDSLGEHDERALPMEGWLSVRALRWDRALLLGDPARALEIASEAARRCAELGLRLWHAEATSASCDAALALGDLPALAAAVDELDELAARTGATRFAREAAFARAVGMGGAPEALEPLVTDASSTTARRARHLLGDDAAADALDRAVLARHARRVFAIRGDVTQRGWGIDRPGRAAWLWNGRRVELGTKPQLWTLLDRLIATPAGCTVAELVAHLWPPEARPDQPNKLLHNLIHKLRKLLDVDGAPPRIVTWDSGYRINTDLVLRMIES